MKVRKHRKRVTRAFIICDQAGHIIETRSLLYSARKDAEVIAREHFGGDGLPCMVREINYEFPDPRGRKVDDKTLEARREFEFSRPERKRHFTKLVRELAQKHFGPFDRSIKQQRVLRKKSDSLERSIRRLQALHKPKKVKKRPSK
jgi:hypothetical protein